MYETISLLPGVTLRCVPAQRFKQSCLSIQFLRPMCREEAALNALIPAILLRGTARRPDLRSITEHLDDLYGASVGELVRRVGDYQAMGLYLSFLEDRFAMTGDVILEPMVDFLEELLLEPVVEEGGFSRDFVAGEKRNLIANLEARKNDKRTYAADQLMQKMCSADSYGIPRLGRKEDVEVIDPVAAYTHYQKVLTQSPVEIFYVGSADPEWVAQRMKQLLEKIPRQPVALPEQTDFHDGGGGSYTEAMDISQGKLVLGYRTDITIREGDYPAMQLFNVIFGAGMTSKLFMNLREKQSLCYYIGSGYDGPKGILTVSAGIDCDQYDRTMEQIAHQLELCQQGQITQQELTAAKESVLSSLRGVYDSPGAIEAYEAVRAIHKVPYSLEQYYDRIAAVTLERVIQAAQTVSLHTGYFLKGVEA